MDRDERTVQANRADGFSLIEIMVVVAVIAILGGMIVPVTAAMISRAKAEGASVVAMTWLETARNRAVAERRNFRITFDTPVNHITVQRVESDLSLTPIADFELPDQLRFLQVTGALDTPDGFGFATAIDFDGPAPYAFTSDGSLIDANGDPTNGTIFLSKPGQRETAHALTFFGVTGLMRNWKLAGIRWHR